MNKKKDLIKNTLIIAFGKAASQMAAFFLLPLYTYFLTPSEYGFVDLVTTYLIIAIPALTVQLELAAFRFLVDVRDKSSEKTRVISNILYMVTPVIVCMAVLLELIGRALGLPHTELIILAAITMMFSSLFLQVARGLGDNKRFAKASIIVGSSTVVTAVVLIAIFKLGAAGMFLSLAISNLAGALYLLMSLKVYKYIELSAKDKVLQRDMIGYSAPLVPNGIAWWTTNAADRTVIALILGSAANGVYAVSSKYSAILSSLFSVFAMSWTESASLNIKSKDRDTFFSDVANAAVQFFGSASMSIIAVIPLVFSLLVDESFNEAYLYIPILVLGALFSSIAGIYNSIYVAKKLTRQVMNSSLVSATISIILTLVLIPFLGLYGAAIGTAIAFLSMSAFRHYDVQKYVTIRYDALPLTILGGAFVVVAGLYYLNNPILNILNVAFAAACAIFLNRSIVKIVKTKIMNRLRPLTPDQQVAEEIEEQVQSGS